MGVQIAFDFDAFAATAPARQREGRVRSRPPVQSALATLPQAPGPDPVRGGPQVQPAPAAALTRALLSTAAREAVEPVRLTRASLEAMLRRLCGPRLTVLLTDNERTMISTRARADQVVLRVHHMFLDADAETLLSLAGYLNKSDPSAGPKLFAFVKRNRARIRKSAVRRIHLRSEGRHHDLSSIYDEVNGAYFAGSVDACISWAKHTSPQRRSRRSIKLGSYNSRDRLIRVHPVLDADWVPGFFVEYIVYHEMLHQVIPPEARGGRREYHGAKFRACERKFLRYEEAIAWEQKHLGRLLRG